MIRNRRLDPLTFLPLCVVALAWLAVPAAPARAEGSAESPLRTGAWAVVFEIDPSYSYSFGYAGSATLSVKRHWSEGRAYLAGLSVGFAESETDGTRRFDSFGAGYYPDPYSEAGPVDAHGETHEYRLFLHAMRYRPVRERLSVFVDAGPSVRYYEYKSSYERSYPYSGQGYRSNTTETRRGVGLDGNIGFEWFFSKRLALGARYGAFAQYEWGRRTASDENFASDGAWYQRSAERGDVKRVQVGTSRATVLFTAYL